MRNESCKITLNVGNKEYIDHYEKKIAESAEDILAMLSDEKQVKDVIKAWNYGSDLFAKTRVRNALAERVAGPEKTIEKLVKDLVKMHEAMGSSLTEEAARKMVQALQPANQGATA